MRLIDEQEYQNRIAQIPIEKRTFRKAWETAQEMPEIEAEPVRHGEWLYSDIYLPNCAECSECGWKSSASGNEIPSYHYCPNCGAKMDKDVRK